MKKYLIYATVVLVLAFGFYKKVFIPKHTFQTLSLQSGSMDIVDNIAYLDALSKKIYNLALYKQALNDYEIAKANYYFMSGIEYKKILKKLI